MGEKLNSGPSFRFLLQTLHDEEIVLRRNERANQKIAPCWANSFTYNQFKTFWSGLKKTSRMRMATKMKIAMKIRQIEYLLMAEIAPSFEKANRALLAALFPKNILV